MSAVAKMRRILLIEDNPGDGRLTAEILSQGQSSLYQVQDGEEAIRFLRKEGEYRHSPRPDLVVMDIGLPKMDGRELLVQVKQDTHLKAIPVVVFTSGACERLVDEAYALHANCVIYKPFDLERYIHTLETMERFWFNTAKLPENPRRDTYGQTIRECSIRRDAANDSSFKGLPAWEE